MFAALSGYGVLSGWNGTLVRVCALLCVALLCISWAKPKLLDPLNRAWFALGYFLGRIVNPVVQGAIFFLLITPIALLMRAAGRDALGLRRTDAASYWVERTAQSRDSSSFKNPF